MNDANTTHERIGDDVDRLRRDDGMGEELTNPDDWAAWAAQLGGELLPELRAVRERLPRLRAAMICTSDGFNVCSIGVDVESIGQLAALSSSLHSLAGATVRTLVGEPTDDTDMVSSSIGPTTFVVTAVPEVTAGSLLLLVAADDTMLGTIMMHARALSERVLTHVFTR